jgi:hypothetical protein
MKIILLSLLFSSNIVAAQTVYLEREWPITRAGDKLSIFINYLTEDDPFNPNPEIVIEQIGALEIKVGNSTGFFPIGPLSFPFNGKIVEVAPLTIEILPELEKVEFGLWVSYVEFHGRHVIVLEEYTPSTETNRVKLVYTPTKEDPVVIRESSWKKEIRTLQIVDKTYKNDPYASITTKKVNYHMTIYELNFSDPEVRMVNLTRDNFMNIREEHNLLGLKIAKN